MALRRIVKGTGMTTITLFVGANLLLAGEALSSSSRESQYLEYAQEAAWDLTVTMMPNHVEQAKMNSIDDELDRLEKEWDDLEAKRDRYY